MGFENKYYKTNLEGWILIEHEDVRSIELFDAVNIVIPEKIEGFPVYYIEEMIFTDCVTIKSITLPDTLKGWDEGTFDVYYKDELIIYGTEGSRAQKKAIEEGLHFVAK